MKGIFGQFIIELRKRMNKEILQKLRNNEIDLKRILKYLIPLTILLLVLVGIILFKPAIRGYVIGTEVASYVDNLNLVVDENKSYEWQLSHPGDITTLRVSGSLSKGGTAKVYLQYQSKKYLIFDSSQLLTSDLTPITGYAVLEGGESSENNQSIQNRDITERLVYNDGSIYDEDNNGIEPIEGVIDYSVKDSIFKWDVNYSNVCTKWEVNNGENSTFICYGAERCCDFIDLVPSRERWDDSFNLNYGKYGAGLNNTVSAQIVYVDYSLDPSNPYTDIRHSELASLKAIFQPELYSFKESCLETCLLANFNHSSYNLIFEIDNATLNIDSISYTIIQPVNVTLENVTILNETLIQYKVKINEPVKWSKNVKLSGKAANISFEVPSEALNISVYKVEKGIRTQSEKVLVKADNETARVNLYNEIHKKPKKKENITLIMEERVDEVEAEYYTEGPTATEEKISANKKRIIVNSEIHYENILAYTSLKTEAKASLVHLYWLVNNSRIQVNINKYDNNGNGLIDYVEWTVPSLSNQTYELVIEITKAEHLDENREFISDIYNEVYQLDGIWSETIPSEHYVRVTFEKLLDNTRDITLYPRVVSGNPKIEIYEVHGTKIVAEFFNLTSNEYNKVYLTSLQGSQDVFDLRVVNGSVEIDHIIDPAQTVIYYLKNGSTSYFDTIPPTGGHANTTCNVGANGGDCTYTWVRNESYSQTTNITTAKMTGRIYWNGVSGTSKPDYANIKSVSVINCSSPNCASYSTICQDAPANGYIDCYNIDTIGCNSTINCTPAAVTLATGQYLGFIVVAHSKSVDVKVRWNSSTLPAYFNVTELPLDTISPNVVLNSPINRTNTSSYNISFNFTGTDSSGIKNATLWANFSGTWRANSSNQTTLTSGTSALINVTNVPEGYFVWNVYVCDNATTPNCGFNESNFTIRVDRSGPVISFNSPANNTWQNNQQVTLRYTAVDPTLGNCTLYGNFNGNWQANQTNISITSGSQDSITVTLTNGTYLWNVMCSDNLGNSAFNLTNYTVSVDSIRPDITLNLPANNYNSSVNYTNFNWTVIDNLDTNLSCNLTINSTVNTSNIGALNNTATNYSVSAFKDGVYNWNITCWDHANNSNTSAMWRFIVDTTAPTTQLNAPANNTWQTFQSVTLQYTPSDGYLKNCTLYGNFNGTWQANQTNTTVTSGSKDSITLTLTNGTYLWNVLCYDFTGNSAFNSTNYTVSIDSIQPGITLNLPANGYSTSDTYINFNWTATDNLDNNLSCNLTINSIVNVSGIASSNSTATNQSVSDFNSGTYQWNITCIDNASNTNTSETRIFTVDTTAPTTQLNAPANNTWQTSQSVTLQYTPSDGYLKNCTLFGNFNGTWQANQTNTTVTSGSKDSITLTLTNGTYLWNVLCYDFTGNSAFNSTNYTVSIDSIQPGITLNLPANGYSTSDTYINFNWTATDNLDNNLSCNLTINSIVNVSGIASSNSTATNQSVSDFNSGTYQWNITCIDNASNTNTSETRIFTVDTTAPTTQLNAPANNTWQTSQSVTLQYTPSDGYLKNCTLFGNFNGTWQANQTNTTVTSGSKDSITLTLTNGTYLWNVLCYDFTGNSAFNSTNYTVSIDSIQPGITLNLPANGYSTSDTYINFNWTATDNLDNNLSCNLTINSIVNVSGIASSNSTATNQSVSGFTEGNYKWNTTCIDNAFNVNTSETRIFWIGVAPNVTNLNAIPQKALNGTTVIVNAIVTDNTAVSNVIAMFFYPNRSAWQNITMGNISTNYNTTITASFIPAGTYSVTIWANDSSNLVNNSESTWFAPYLNLGKSAEITIDGSFADWNETINVSDLLSDTGENNYIWNFSWGFGGNDVALGVATDTNNNFIVAGYNGSIGWRIMKFNSSNDNVWNFSIISGIAYAVATDTNNNFIVAGNNGTGWWIMKFNSSNDNVWNFNTDLGGDDRAMAIATDTNNNFIVAGYNESGTNPDSFIMKFNSSNDNIWNWTRNLGGYDKFQAVATDTNNNFIVAGYNGSGWLIRKFNSSNDNVWNFSNNFGVTSIAYAVATDKNSNFIVAGKNATSDWFIMEFNSSNDNIWNFSRDLGGPAGALGVATDTNNSFIVAGYNASGWWIMKFNSSNDNIWNWSGDLGGTSDKAQAVATDTNNNFIVAGNNGTTGNIDWFIMKFAGGGGVNFDLNKVSLSNNAQYLFARINVNGIVDYNNTAKKYRLYITKDESTGTATSPEGTVLAINYSYRIEGFNSSLWKVYNASNDNIFNASAANDSSSIELAINLTEINLSTSDSINVTFETAGYDYSFDFAPDYRSFLSYQLAETAVEGSPTLTLNSPLNNTWQQSQTVLFNYTPSGSNLDACVLYGDFSGSWAANETNSSPDNGQADTITLTLTNGTYTWNVMCNNTAGASAFNSTNYTFTIDTVQPGITLNAPVNSYNSSVNYINFNWTVTDNLDANLSCNITINSTVNMSNIGSSNSVATNNSVSGFIDSTYYWNISCIDHANNSNTSTMRRFTVDTTPPYFINLTNATIYDNESLYYDVNASDNGVGVHQFSINWTSTFSINATSGLITNISILNAGLYYINVTVNDTLNNRNSSILLVNVSATNSPPIIFYVNQTNITLVAGTAVTVNITFNVSDQDGFGNLDDSTAQANVTFNGVTRSSSSCTPNDYESIYTEYSCEVTFYYYDNASLNWVINATVRDNSGVAAVNDTVALQVKSLSSMSLIGNLTFSNIYLGEQDKTPDNDYILNNTGNFDFTLANITAYDLVGRSNPSYKIGVGNFTINTTDAVAGSGIQLQDGTSLNVTGAILPHKTSNSDANAIETIYFWLDVPDSSQITVQDYNSSIWQVIVS